MATEDRYLSECARRAAETYHDTVFPADGGWYNDDADPLSGSPHEHVVRFETRPKWEAVIQAAIGELITVHHRHASAAIAKIDRLESERDGFKTALENREADLRAARTELADAHCRLGTYGVESEPEEGKCKLVDRIDALARDRDARETECIVWSKFASEVGDILEIGVTSDLRTSILVVLRDAAAKLEDLRQAGAIGVRPRAEDRPCPVDERTLRHWDSFGVAQDPVKRMLAWLSEEMRFTQAQLRAAKPDGAQMLAALTGSESSEPRPLNIGSAGFAPDEAPYIGDVRALAKVVDELVRREHAREVAGR